jgi:hypothetical protein
MRDREEGLRMRGKHGLLLAEILDANRQDGPLWGCSSPNRLMSALLNGRSHANALPATNQGRLPCRSPSLTSGSSQASRVTSSRVATLSTVPA